HGVPGCANHRFWTAADGDPGFELASLYFRENTLVGKRRTRSPAPGHRLVAQKCRKEIELLFEKPFILVEFKSEKRKRLRERAAPEYDFGPSVRHRVERG